MSFTRHQSFDDIADVLIIFAVDPTETPATIKAAFDIFIRDSKKPKYDFKSTEDFVAEYGSLLLKIFRSETVEDLFYNCLKVHCGDTDKRYAFIHSLVTSCLIATH